MDNKVNILQNMINNLSGHMTSQELEECKMYFEAGNIDIEDGIVDIDKEVNNILDLDEYL